VTQECPAFLSQSAVQSGSCAQPGRDWGLLATVRLTGIDKSGRRIKRPAARTPRHAKNVGLERVNTSFDDRCGTGKLTAAQHRKRVTEISRRFASKRYKIGAALTPMGARPRSHPSPIPPRSGPPFIQ
jgi:hypothetical protein